MGFLAEDGVAATDELPPSFVPEPGLPWDPGGSAWEPPADQASIDEWADFARSQIEPTGAPAGAPERPADANDDYAGPAPVADPPWKQFLPAPLQVLYDIGRAAGILQPSEGTPGVRERNLSPWDMSPYGDTPMVDEEGNVDAPRLRDAYASSYGGGSGFGGAGAAAPFPVPEAMLAAGTLGGAARGAHLASAPEPAGFRPGQEPNRLSGSPTLYGEGVDDSAPAIIGWPGNPSELRPAARDAIYRDDFEANRYGNRLLVADAAREYGAGQIPDLYSNAPRLAELNRDPTTGGWAGAGSLPFNLSQREYLGGRMGGGEGWREWGNAVVDSFDDGWPGLSITEDLGTRNVAYRGPDGRVVSGASAHINPRTGYWEVDDWGARHPSTLLSGRGAMEVGKALRDMGALTASGDQMSNFSSGLLHRLMVRDALVSGRPISPEIAQEYPREARKFGWPAGGDEFAAELQRRFPGMPMPAAAEPKRVFLLQRAAEPQGQAVPIMVADPFERALLQLKDYGYGEAEINDLIANGQFGETVRRLFGHDAADALPITVR